MFYDKTWLENPKLKLFTYKWISTTAEACENVTFEQLGNKYLLPEIDACQNK